MLTYLKTVYLKANDLRYKLRRTLRAGHWDDNPFALPSGRFDVYRQGSHCVLCPKGQDPHDYDGTFYYVSGEVAGPARKARS
jgi:hypothetical protein